MTMIALPHPVVLAPFSGATGFGDISAAIGSQTSFVLNAAGDKLAILFVATSTTPPDLIAFHISAATAGTTGVVEATLENVTAGDPSGAVTNSATGSATISTVSTSGAPKTISGMSGTASLTTGTIYAVVLTAGSGFDRALTIRISNGSTSSISFPAVKSKDTAGAWAGESDQGTGACFGLADSGGTYMSFPGQLGAFTTSSTAFSSATNPDERGNRFSLAIAARVCGVHVMSYPGSNPGTANDDIKVKLLSSHTATPVTERSTTVEGEARSGGHAATVYFASGFDCAANTTYAVTFEALGSETQTTILYTYGSSGERSAVMGSSFYSTTRNDLGNCTDLTTAMYAVFPIISHVDDGAGAGGAVGGGIVGLHGITSGVIA
jgi:hypothetical protein